MVPLVDAMDDEVVLWNMRRHGAPLSMCGAPGPTLSLEETLAHGLLESRKSATVAQTWPVVFAKHRREVGLLKLESLACSLGQGQVLGFFLTVLERLLPDASLGPVAQRLKLSKPSAMSYLFGTDEGGPLYRRLTRMRTPAVAKEWGFWMNMDLDDFRSCLLKFLPRHETVL